VEIEEEDVAEVVDVADFPHAVVVDVEEDFHHEVVLVVVGVEEDVEVPVVVGDLVEVDAVEWGVVRKLLLSPIVMRACLSPEARKMLCVPRTWSWENLFMEKSVSQQRRKLESWSTESGILSVVS